LHFSFSEQSDTKLCVGKLYQISPAGEDTDVPEERQMTVNFPGWVRDVRPEEFQFLTWTCREWTEPLSCTMAPLWPMFVLVTGREAQNLHVFVPQSRAGSGHG